MPIARYYPLSVIVEEASARILRQIERNILKDPSPSIYPEVTHAPF
jgi:hypothetical protein